MSQILQTGAGNISIDRRLLPTNTKVVVSQREFAKIAADGLPATLTDLGPGLLFSIPVTLSAIATANFTAATLPVTGFGGRIVSVFAVSTTPASTVAKTATVGVYIDGVAVRGGAIVLTTANLLTPAGKVVSGSLIVDQARTGTNEFLPTSVITFKTPAAPAPTTFTEGVVVFGLIVAPDRKVGPVEY